MLHTAACVDILKKKIKDCLLQTLIQSGATDQQKGHYCLSGSTQ